MNPADKFNRFLDFINEASLEHLPNTAILYRGDDSVIRSVEVHIDPELFSILSRKEQSALMDCVLQELIQRTHASSALFATEGPGVLALHYESATQGLSGVYQILRDGGAIRVKPVAPTPTASRFKDFFL